MIPSMFDNRGGIPSDSGDSKDLDSAFFAKEAAVEQENRGSESRFRRAAPERWPDAVMIAQLRRKDAAVMTDVVNNHARPLFRAARGMGFGPEKAEDLVQEVFATFLETLDRFEGRSRIRTWLFGILHRKVLERRRSEYRETRHDPIDDVVESRFDGRGGWARPPADLERLIESKQTGELIADCAKRLPQKQREVFVLRDMEELSTDQVCKILDISRTNLFVLVHRARNRLRECLEEKELRRGR
jgi:RNA polymerase sigma-70 factor, ECF subfamily